MDKKQYKLVRPKKTSPAPKRDPAAPRLTISQQIHKHIQATRETLKMGPREIPPAEMDRMVEERLHPEKDVDVEACEMLDAQLAMEAQHRRIFGNDVHPKFCPFCSAPMKPRFWVREIFPTHSDMSSGAFCDEPHFIAETAECCPAPQCSRAHHETAKFSGQFDEEGQAREWARRLNANRERNVQK